MKYSIWVVCVILSLISCMNGTDGSSESDESYTEDDGYRSYGSIDFGFADDYLDIAQAVGFIEALESSEPNQMYEFITDDAGINYDSIVVHTEFLQTFWEDDSSMPTSTLKKWQSDTNYYERIYYTRDSNNNFIYKAQFVFLLDARYEKKKVFEVFVLKNDEVIPRDKAIQSVYDRTYNKTTILPHDVELLKKITSR